MADLSNNTTIGGFRQLHENISKPVLFDKLTIEKHGPDSVWKYSDIGDDNISLELGLRDGSGSGSIRLNSYNANEFCFIRSSDGNLHIDSSNGIYYFNWDPSSNGSANGQINLGTASGTNGVELNSVGTSYFYGGGLSVNGNTSITGTLNVSSTITGSLSGNASTQSKLQTARTISLAGDVTGSTTFDGSQNVSITATVADDSHNHSNATITSVDWSKLTNVPDPTITLSGDVTGQQTMTNLGSITITATVVDDSHNHSNATITSVDWSKLTNVPDPTITLSGDVTGQQTMTNLGSITITTTVADDSHTHDTRYYTETEADSRFVNVTGDTMTGSLLYSGDQDYKGIYWGSKYEDGNQYSGEWAYIRQGTAAGQIEIGSDDKIDIYETDSRALAVSISTNNKSLTVYGNITANTITGSLSGNASTQTKLQTARTISLAGDVTGSTTFDGSQNVSITTTVANDSHTHDTRYYTETEADSRFAALSHTHSYLSNSQTSTQTIGGRTFNYNLNSTQKINVDPRWNSDGTGTDTGNLHIWATKADGTNYGQAGIALYNGANAKYQYIYTVSGYWTRLKNYYGYIDFGPANTSYAHIYTDRPAFYFNKDIRGQGKVYGAVYNDYAEYRSSDEPIDFGFVQIEDEKGNVIKCNEDRSKKVQGVSSDTLGFQIGKQKDTDTPIAVAGRVLVYQVNKHKLKVGDQVCSTKEGKVRKMKLWEKIFFPEQIVGYVSEFPDYDIWSSDNIKVNGRIWIRI